MDFKMVMMSDCRINGWCRCLTQIENITRQSYFNKSIEFQARKFK